MDATLPMRRMKLKDLIPAPYNPRRMNSQQRSLRLEWQGGHATSQVQVVSHEINHLPKNPYPTVVETSLPRCASCWRRLDAEHSLPATSPTPD